MNSKEEGTSQSAAKIHKLHRSKNTKKTSLRWQYQSPSASISILTQANKQRRTNRTQLSRRGGVTVFVLLASPLLIACMALALDIAMLSYQTRQTQTACDAAALAGVVELMDRSSLYPEGLQQRLSLTEFSASAPHIAEKQVALARAHSQAYAAQNVVGRQPLDLEANHENHPDGDIVVGWVSQPHRRGFPLQAWSGEGPINSLLVRGNRQKQRGNAVTFWIAKMFGLSDVDLTASARATIYDQVYGFRPNGHVAVPLMPIAIHPSSGPQNWLESAPLAGTSNSGSDDFSVDDRTGIVASGGDGIPEVVLRLRHRESLEESINATFVSFHPRVPAIAGLQRRIAYGYRSGDLQMLGGELAFGKGSLEVPVVELGSDVPTSVVVQALLKIRGEKRVWLLGDRPNKSGRCSLSGFVAGRVLACYTSPDTGLEVVIQPCIFSTCTALVGPDWPHNPWIGKVMLSE